MNALGASLMAVASRRRSILKTLSYRAIVTVILAVVTFVFTELKLLTVNHVREYVITRGENIFKYIILIGKAG
jgi:hypothetical protein